MTRLNLHAVDTQRLRPQLDNRLVGMLTLQGPQKALEDLPLRFDPGRLAIGH